MRAIVYSTFLEDKYVTMAQLSFIFISSILVGLTKHYMQVALRDCIRFFNSISKIFSDIANVNLPCERQIRQRHFLLTTQISSIITAVIAPHTQSYTIRPT